MTQNKLLEYLIYGSIGITLTLLWVDGMDILMDLIDRPTFNPEAGIATVLVFVMTGLWAIGIIRLINHFRRGN